MGVLEGRQISGIHLAFYAYTYGKVPIDQLETCLAIAYGESQWFERAFNDNPHTGDKSYGIWQINMIGALRAERMRQYNLTREDELFNLAKNAECMGIIRRQSISWGTDQWGQWGAYTNGSYRRHTALAWLGVRDFKARLQESGERLHVGEPADCDSL